MSRPILGTTYGFQLSRAAKGPHQPESELGSAAKKSHQLEAETSHVPSEMSQNKNSVEHNPIPNHLNPHWQTSLVGPVSLGRRPFLPGLLSSLRILHPLDLQWSEWVERETKTNRRKQTCEPFSKSCQARMVIQRSTATISSLSITTFLDDHISG